jgi:hypothetical protein
MKCSVAISYGVKNEEISGIRMEKRMKGGMRKIPLG